MIGGNEMYRINNVAARVVSTFNGADFYHPDCLPTNEGIREDEVSIDHEYCGGDGRITRWDDTCEGCGLELGDSGGVQPEDDEEEDEDEDPIRNPTDPTKSEVKS